MNIHPIFVHFPVAFFTFYALAELARIQLLTRQPYWFYIKASLVILGCLGGVAAIVTGQMAEDIMRGSPALEKHEMFAFLTFGVFGFLALCYAAAWLRREVLKNPAMTDSSISVVGSWAEKIVAGWPAVVLALLGLALVTITGSLGGSMVYGPATDPVVKIIYQIFVR